LIARERATYRDRFPGSARAFANSADHLLGGVPMTWMRMWSGGFTLTATDANRWAIRLARQLTRRTKIVVFSYCYHGSVDESFIVATPDGPRSREGNVGAPVDPAETTRVVEFNDAVALEQALRHGDVAAVLMEPALTNIGIVLPEPGFLSRVRELTIQYGSLLVNDETHTFSAGPGGCTRAGELHPDIVTIGKSIAGGIPAGAYGLSSDLAEKILTDPAAFHNMALMCPATTMADADAHTTVFAEAAGELLL
ncbi:MAG TPA: aminotransferase class III-fold pyridoxal phosphate-dependent enzyme, partial [Streptosporangiaceae bacterium]